ncbi:MAG: DUF3313 family protein [Pseudomonadota bacterium]
MNPIRTVGLALAAVTLAGCASTPEFQQGPDAEVTFDGLTRLTGTTMDTVWARTDTDLKGYTKVMFEGVGIEYRPVTGPYSGRAGRSSSINTGNRSEYQLDDATKQRFEETISKAFRDAIASSKTLQVVDKAGPDVLLIRGGLLDVVSNVPPEPMGRGDIYISKVGEATLVLEIRDSESEAIFARAVDRRAAEPAGNQMRLSNRATNAAEVRRLGQFWGNLLRKGLEELTAENAAN